MITKFIWALLSDNKKSLVGPKIIKLYKELSENDKSEVKDILLESPYNEILDMINYYGDFAEKYPYNLMRAGIWLRNRYRENLNKSHISYPDPPETDFFTDIEIGKFLVRIGFWKYLSVDPSMYDFTLECNKSYFRQLERWCNLIINKPGCSYTIEAGKNKRDFYCLLQDLCWLKITEI